ncbi:sensor histidine kinase [Streptomyces graminofaciens]|uniref:sensor histidine kinase n=1 Tax=Streptomyces graminofaciens TaxID=68212 RepID=UPI002573C23C|nr:nitrate- and nitrite sensing domain-containing protein [Streptomyces graminofaciens]
MPFVVPAVLATGIWGYTAAGLVDEQIRLGAETDRATSVAAPTQTLLSRLQEERRLTAVWQTSRTDSDRTKLEAAREKTDSAVTSYRKASMSALDTGTLQSRAEKLDEALDNLAERRKAIDDRELNAADAFQYFTGAVSSGMDLFTTAVRSDDADLVHGAEATSAVVRLTEMLSREDALISGALPSRRITAQARTQFAQYLAVQQSIRAALGVRDLPAGGAASYGEITDSAQWTSIGVVEDAMANGEGTDLPRQAPSWPAASALVVGDLQALGAEVVRGHADAGSERADDLLVATLLGSAATLVALLTGALLAVRGRRSALGRIAELQQRAEELSGVWLPQLLSRIERGERIDPQPLAPQRHSAADEMERLATAIDTLGRVAAETAVRQSLGREGSEKVFAQLIRRTQILIHRLISLLDDLERKHEDSDLLKDIFKVDHLATRVRRHAENLVILSGSPPTRRMTAPVSITDVMRSAVAETEAYTRVKIKNQPADRRLALTGRAVSDVTHLLAELIENGTSFSPPDTQVTVSATKVAKGLAIHVEDHGLGVPEELRHKANHLLAHPPKVDMTALGEDPRLGHFVVARLAERNNIKVELRESVYGGTLVVVLLPGDLLEEIDSPVLDQLTAAAAASNLMVSTGSGERPGLGTAPGRSVSEVSEPEISGVLAGVGATVSSGAADHTLGGAAGDVLTHTRVPDYSGFPDYGGAGLLPPVDNPAAGASGSASWTPSPASSPPPSQEHPAHHMTGGVRGHAEPGAGGTVGGYGDAGGTTTGGGYGGGAGTTRAGYDGGAGTTRAGYDGGAGTTRAGDGFSAGDARGARDGFGGGAVPGAGGGYGARPDSAGGNGRPAPASPRPPSAGREASESLATPQVLPQRTRGASLAQQLRKEAADGVGEGPGEGGLSPDASARAMMAIQQGLKRARLDESGEPNGTDHRPAPPHDPGAL